MKTLTTFQRWAMFTILFFMIGLLAAPLVLICMLGMAGCCSGSGNWIESIPAWPALPLFWFWLDVLNGNDTNLAHIFVFSAIGYGLIPTYYYFILRPLWRRICKPCTPY